MAKGSMFWSNARGRVGDIVFSQLHGETITRKHQPSPTNPKTNKQMLQRAKFSNAVKFYKHAQQALFKFAYEDRKTAESEFNAFMRHNAQVAMCPNRASFVSMFPSIGKSYMLADGSLEPIANATDDTETTFFSDLAFDDKDTIASFSKTLVDSGRYEYGDIVTFVTVSSEVSDIDETSETEPVWSITQIKLSDSSAPMSDALPLDLVYESTGGHCQLTTVHSGAALAASVIISRVTAKGTLVTTAYLINNKAANDIYDKSEETGYRNKALESWGASGDAILQGSLS